MMVAWGGKGSLRDDVEADNATVDMTVCSLCSRLELFEVSLHHLLPNLDLSLFLHAQLGNCLVGDEHTWACGVVVPAPRLGALLYVPYLYSRYTSVAAGTAELRFRGKVGSTNGC